MYDTAFTVGIALFMLRYVGMEAVYQRAKWTGSGLRFPTTITFRVLFRIGAPLLMYASYKVFEERTTTFDIFAAATGGILGLACLLWEPGELSTGFEGVKYRRYLGLQKRFIPWGSVVASYMPAMREVLVIGKNGVHFTHTQYHVGQDEFVRELRRHGVFFHGDPINGNPRKK